jgi:hypothetical protein
MATTSVPGYKPGNCDRIRSFLPAICHGKAFPLTGSDILWTFTGNCFTDESIVQQQVPAAQPGELCGGSV